jgi:predicted dehydrogenase
VLEPTVTDPTATTGQLRVGVAGAGPWSHLFHAPMLASHPLTTLSAVWARRHSAAEEVAGPYGAVAHDSFDRFLDDVDAVAFAVPPDIQAALAPRAARAGKALLLEKPLALDVAGAEALAQVVAEAGVATQMVLTWRYVPEVRALLEEVARTTPMGGRGWFLSGGFLGGPFATPWRLEQGPLYDLGPHVVDLLDAALGTVVGIRAHGDRRRWVGLLLEHEGGAVSEASLTGTSPVEPVRAGVEVHTTEGVLEVATVGVSASASTTIVDEFVATVRTGTPHPLDVGRGLHLQRLLAAAAGDVD